MKIFHIVRLMVAALSVTTVYSLECYHCLTPTPSGQCMTRKNCSGQETWCFSTVYGPTESGYPFVGDRNVIRDCAENCRPSNPNNLGIVRPTLCCQSDVCNISSEAPSIGAFLWLILGTGTFILALGFCRL